MSIFINRETVENAVSNRLVKLASLLEKLGVLENNIVSADMGRKIQLLYEYVDATSRYYEADDCSPSHFEISIPFDLDKLR